MRFEIVNGMNLREKQVVGYVDTTSLVIQKEQLQAQKKAVAAKLTELKAREAVHIQQIDNLQTTFKRIAGLFDEDAATQQQFDDIDGKVKLAQKQLRQIKTQRNSILSEMNVIDKKIKLVNHQIDKAVIISPVNSKVIEKLVDRGEVVNMGAPLFTLADLEQMNLRVYMSGDQLAHIRIGQQVQVLIDESKTKMLTLTGTISWISDEAEFTPRIIQTRKERVKLVYAVKILVHNDGAIKIGMPGEVKFQ